MMRIFFCGLMIALCALAAMATDDRTAAGLHHMVKRVVEERALPGEAGRTLVSETDYDMVGNLRRLRSYQDGVLQAEENRAYAASGLLLTSTVTDGTGAPIIRALFIHDAQGRLVSRVDNAVFCSQCIGDAGAASQPCSYTFDREGRLATIESKSNGFATKQAFTYNAAGHLIAATTTTGNDRFALTESRRIDVDAQGRPKYETVRFNGEEVVKILTLYNPQGEVSFRYLAATGEAPQQESYAYTYDRMGNWITRATYRILPGKATPSETFVPGETTYRAITYYP